jgi:cytochrome c oxidase subunit 4
MSEPNEKPEHHIVPLSVYYAVFAALMVLTFLTVEAAKYELGYREVLSVKIPLNVVAALVIATTKATLVVLFFMHVLYSPRLIKLVVLGAVVWLVILLAITLSDYASRNWLGNPGT